ncbi:MAG: cysteine desulfurase [Candidatus Doudnabacteria bacterium]|nr:cysteine desulfurase [Candidatus Doudnabacteria bacterium]
MKKFRKIIYLDYAAATPLDVRVLNAMRPFLTSTYGNPSSLHRKGLEAKNAVEKSRKSIADIIGARPEEIIFMSGGTEACNLAVFGVAKHAHISTKIKTSRHKPHIVTTVIEHHAVLEPIKILQKLGWGVTFLPVDMEGLVNIDNLKKAIRKETKLVSVMYANNEIGSVQPIAEIGRVLARINTERGKYGLMPTLLHTDACQAAGAFDLNVNRLQVDLMSVSASKFYGPKDSGFLYVKNGTPTYPIILGGGQERGLRSGTENVAGIVGMAKALEVSVSQRERENQRLAGLRDYLINRLKQKLPKFILNGSSLEGKQVGKEMKNFISSKTSGRYKMMTLGSSKRLPNNVNLAIPGVEGEALMLYLDARGICVSTGSACATGSTDASHVLKAIGRTEKQAKESIRITLGRDTKKSDVDYLIKSLKECIPLILDER